MANGISRRDWMKLVGGSAIGFMLTPIPWKILDESAKWTQSPSFPYGRQREIQIHSNERISFSHTTCTLCPMACGVRVRCASERGRGSLEAVGITGTKGHPISDGSLCALGVAAIFLRYHPSRLHRPVKIIGHGKFVPVSLDEAISDIARAISRSSCESVAVLDNQPDRAISHIYRKFVGELKNGFYINPPTCDGVPTRLTDQTLHTGDLAFGYDVNDARMIVSFGTPILDGWGTQRQFASISEARRCGGDKKLKLIQVETAHSRTAQIADEWIPVRPGTESAFALGMANVMVRERLCNIDRLRMYSADFDNAAGDSFMKLIEKYPPAYVSEKTGIPADKLVEVTREVARRKPAIVMFGGNPGSGPFRLDEQLAFMGLNILLGSIGTKGGLKPRGKLPSPYYGLHGSDDSNHLASMKQLSDIPDGSIGVLIMDGADSGCAIPWETVERKLSPAGHTIVSLAPYLAGNAVHADYILPSPAYLETADDVPTPSSATVASYSVVSPIFSAPKFSVRPNGFINSLAEALNIRRSSRSDFSGMEYILKKRVEKLHSLAKGNVFNAETGRSERLSGLSLPQFLERLKKGGCWIDDGPAELPPIRYSFLGGTHLPRNNVPVQGEGNNGPRELVLLPLGTRGVLTAAQSNPIMSKLYQESGLRMSANTVSVNPSTGRAAGLKDGGKARVRTENGTAYVMVRFDKSVMPGIIQASVVPLTKSPDRAEPKIEDSVIDICKIDSDSTWRITNAMIEPA